MLSENGAQERMKAYHVNASQAILWAHSSWIAELLDVNEVMVAELRRVFMRARPEVIEECSSALIAAAGIMVPDESAWVAPAIERNEGLSRSLNFSVVDMLPIPVALQVLRMRALLFRREELRRIVDRKTQDKLTEWIGIDVGLFLADIATDKPMMGLVNENRGSVPTLYTVDECSLAQVGLVLFRRDGASGSLLVRLLFDRRDDHHVWRDDILRGGDVDGSQTLFNLLKNSGESWSWLFK